MVDVTFTTLQGTIIQKKITQEVWDIGFVTGFWQDGNSVCILKNHKMVKI